MDLFQQYKNIAAQINSAAVSPQQQRQRSARRGRPRNTDPEEDRRMYEQWKASGERTYADFARKKGYKPNAVEAAVDRHRKRLEDHRNNSATEL